MPAPRSLALVGGRIGLGVVGIAVSAAVVGAAFALPRSAAEVADVRSQAVTIAPVPTDSVAACAGPLLSISAAASTAAVTPFGEAAVAAAVPVGSAEGGTLKATDGAATAAQTFRAPAEAGEKTPPALGAAQSQVAGQPDIAGLAASACSEPGAEQWLAAGATSLGENSLVVLGNPGGVAATVDLAVFDEQGAVDSPAGHGIVVQPGTQRAVPLAGIAPGAKATVVHVTATGGTVSAALQQSTVSGLTPLGVETTGATTAPATALVVPGVVVTQTQGPAAASDDDQSTPVLRVLDTGAADANLTIGVRGANGAAGGTAKTVTVSAGQVSEVPLDRMPAGSYTVTVGSDQPIVAAVKTSTGGDGQPADYAWFVAASPLADTAAVAVAPGPAATLHLANETSDAKTVTLASGGARTELKVSAGTEVTVPRTSPGATVLSGAAGLYASVAYAAPGQLSSYAIAPVGLAATPLDVYRR